MRHFHFDSDEKAETRRPRPAPRPGERYARYESPTEPLQIEEDKPIPEHLRPRSIRPQVYPFATMKIGESVLIPPPAANNKPYLDAMRSVRRDKGWAFTVDAVPKGTLVRRISDPKKPALLPFKHMAVGDSVFIPLPRDQHLLEAYTEAIKYVNDPKDWTKQAGKKKQKLKEFDCQHLPRGLRIWRIR